MLNDVSRLDAGFHASCIIMSGGPPLKRLKRQILFFEKKSSHSSCMTVEQQYICTRLIEPVVTEMALCC